MPRYSVVATDLFEDDLDQAVSYLLQASGPQSATRLLDEYDRMLELLGTLPGHGTNVHGTPYRWRPLRSFVAAYLVDEDAGTVTLMRLLYVSSDWRTQLLEGLWAQPKHLGTWELWGQAPETPALAARGGPAVGSRGTSRAGPVAWHRAARGAEAARMAHLPRALLQNRTLTRPRGHCKRTATPSRALRGLPWGPQDPSWAVPPPPGAPARYG